MKTETLSEPDYKTFTKYFSGFMLIVMMCFSAKIVQGQIVFSDTREQTEKEEMMQMFRNAQLISDTFKMRKLNNHLFDILYVNDELIMLADGHFDVFHWQKGTWKQISKSRKGGYNYGGKKFVWNNRIFSFGGYGFWQHHGELIEFDPDSGMWNKIDLPSTLPNFPIITTHDGFRIVGDTFFDIKIDKKKVIKFNANFPVDIYSKDTYYGSKPESNLWSVLLLEGQKFFYDKKEKKFYYSELNYDAVPYKYTLKSTDWVQFKNDSIIKWSPDGKIYSTLKISEMVKLYKRFNVDEKENNGLRMLGYITLIFGLIALATFWFIQRRKQTRAKEAWQNDLIRKLLSDKMEAVNTEQLDIMLGIDAIMPLEYRKYRRSRIIHEINEEFNIKYGKELIIRYKDPEDGRRYLYKIGNTGKAQNST